MADDDDPMPLEVVRSHPLTGVTVQSNPLSTVAQQQTNGGLIVIINGIYFAAEARPHDGGKYRIQSPYAIARNRAGTPGQPLRVDWDRFKAGKDIIEVSPFSPHPHAL
jgi:hypothetical protein